MKFAQVFCFPEILSSLLQRLKFPMNEKKPAMVLSRQTIHQVGTGG